MSDPTSTPTFTIRTPADLVALAPLILGFVPSESVVLESFGGSRRTFHVRADLPEGDEEQTCVAEMIRDAARRNDVGQAAILVYSEDADRARRQGALCEAVLAEDGIDLLDVLRVDRDRYYTIGGGTHDDVGTAYDTAAHPFTSHYVMQGRVVHGSRDELAATLECRDPVERDEIGRLADKLAEDLGALPGNDSAGAAKADARWLRGRIKRFLRTGVLPSDAEAARILLLCLEAPLRDVVWIDVNRADADQHVALWSDLVRRAPDELLPQAAGILALAAWVAGEGALAWCAIERARDIGAETFLTKHVGDMLAAAVPPAVWEPMPTDQLPILQP